MSNAKHVYIVAYKGRNVECYGSMEADSNFSVVCDDEYDDCVWVDGNPAGGAFVTWEEVVDCLSSFGWSNILEISAV